MHAGLGLFFVNSQFQQVQSAKDAIGHHLISITSAFDGRDRIFNLSNRIAAISGFCHLGLTLYSFAG